MFEQQHSTPDKGELYRRIFQTIQDEEYCPKDPIAQEDYVLDRLEDLMDENALDADEAQETFHAYIRFVRPDVRIVHLGETVSRPFYE